MKWYSFKLSIYTFSLNTNLSMICQAPGPKTEKIFKSKIEYLKFYWTHCFHNMQMWRNCTLIQSLKCRFINKTTAKVILVWNFELSLLSVNGHGARIYVILKPTNLKLKCPFSLSNKDFRKARDPQYTNSNFMSYII